MSEIKGRIHSVESFGSADGPGVRYIVFLKGCNMRCQYCHNPDTWAKDGGELMTPEEVLKKALRYKTYWKEKGGITVSGGEALLQIDFVTELFRLAKEKGVNTCLDTSGNPFSMDPEYLEKFDLPGRCIMDEEGLSGAAYDLLSQMNEENVCYAEIRFAPLLSETPDMNCNKVIEALLAGLEKGKRDFGIEYGVITCAMRHHSEEENARMLRTAREYL